MEETLSRVAALLGAGSPREAPRRVEALQQELERTREEAERLRSGRVGEKAKVLVAAGEAVNGAKMVVSTVEAEDSRVLAPLCDEVAARAGPAVVLLAAIEGDRVSLACKVSQEVQQRGIRAGEVVAEVARALGGKGGGKASFARGSGREPEKLPAALKAATQRLRELLRG